MEKTSNDSKPLHDSRGKFAKGNHAGGRKEIPFELKAKCRDLAPHVIQVWQDILQDTGAKTSDRIRAGENIMDRAYGKAVQAIEMTGAVAAVDTSKLPEEKQAALLDTIVELYAEETTEQAD